MNILITPDVWGWAIGNLCQTIIKHQKHRFNFLAFPMHPRQVPLEICRIQKYLDDEWTDGHIDLWHHHYYRSSEQALELEPRLRKIPSLITVHGHQNISKIDWKYYDRATIATKWGVAEIGNKTKIPVDHIPKGVDLDRLEYIKEPTKEKTVGYVGRVVPWKNLAKIAKTCKRLGYKVVGSGYVDKPRYWQDEVDKSVVDFNGGVGRGKEPSMHDKDRLYEDMAVFVMYSTGERETGTIPLLEAMARGVPVMATEQGMARDLIEDGKNGVVFNEDNFEQKLKELMENEDLKKKYREAARKTVIKYNEKRYAREMAKSIYKTLYPENHMVSVVIPTFERSEKLIDIIISIDEQDYPAKEIIVVDDNSQDNQMTRLACKKLRMKLRTPIIYINTKQIGYNLALARNLGAIEALGEQLVFLDDRYKMTKGSLTEIAKCHGKEKLWHWGRKIVKGKEIIKKGFVENFSWVSRNQFMYFGMFNERMKFYGGISQDVRERWAKFGGDFNCVPEAKVEQVVSSWSKWNKLDEIWKAKELLRQMYGE